MAIFARDLSVRSYRNFERYDLALDEGVTVLVGRNAQGKTNLVEALQLLTRPVVQKAVSRRTRADGGGGLLALA